MGHSGADREIADLLRRRPLRVVGRFTAASNATLLCDLGDDVRAVYKPRRGEAPLWDFPGGSLHRREVAAYEVDRSLGWGAVPVTVMREDAPHGPGSVQLFVEHDPAEHYFALMQRGATEIVDQLRRMVVFDLLINNADRKGGHVLQSPDGRVWLVDHGVTFHAEPKYRSVAWDFAGEPLPAEVMRDVAEFLVGIRGDDAATRGRLVALLAEDEVAALAARTEALLAASVYPAPTGPRPFPWPLL